MKKKKIRISTVLLLVLLFVLLCVVAGAGWKLYRYYADYSKDRDCPVPNNGSCNKIQKGIGRQCGFKMRLTYHVARHKEEISFLKTIIAKAAACFPYLREMLRIENLCRLVGFDERQTATLVSGKPLEYAGELYSEEHKRKFTTEKAGFQVMKDTTDKTKLVLVIDRKPIVEWFKEQFDKLRQNIRQPIPRQNRLKI